MLGVVGPFEASAGAMNCPYISSSKLAAALGLQKATAYHAQGPEQLEGAAYRFSLCRATAWSGSTPANEAQAQAKISSGKGAVVVIKTDEEVGGTPEAVESWHKEYEQQTEDFHAAGSAFVKAAHGKLLLPSTFGAHNAWGYEAVKHGARSVNGIWYSDSQHDYITIAITEGQAKPGRKTLEKIAATAVPGFGA
jgi:hypothetical protein